ncbi:MAG: MEDS domain-containing protein [Methanobacteriaceae archaeon]|nr:MEDS domain-containing protein [Methanobacteriaceae archaeon]
MDKHKKIYNIEDIKLGDHLCVIYETEDEHRKLLTPYLRQGLEQNEKVFYIVDVHTADAVLNYLRDDGVDVDSYLDTGQLKILTIGESYMREGVFDPDKMINLIEHETLQSIREGYKGLRVTGEMTWALRGLPGSERLIEYEAKLNNFFPDSKCMAICQYHKEKFHPDILMHILETHPLAVIGTEIFDNIYYIPPEEFLSPDLPRIKLDRWIKNLRLWKKIMIELKKE